MRLFSLMINNPRKYHSIAPKGYFLINTQVGLNVLLIPSIIYFKMSRCIISASDNCVA